jgi:hypothetical protein
VRIDPQTLRVLDDRRLDIGSYGFGWSFSADGSHLALGGDVGNTAVPGVLVVDTRGMRVLGRARLARSGWLRATTWLPDGRLVVVLSVFTSGVHTDVVTLNAAGTKVLKRQSLSGQVQRVAWIRGGLVALLAATDSLAPARLAVVGPSGAARVVVIGRILAGSKRRENRRGGAEFMQRDPGLAIDPARRRAFVVSADAHVAEVDLASRAVVYHRLARPLSSFAASRPDAAEKSIAGPTRVARWLGSGQIAVSGGAYSVTGKGASARFRFAPLGLELIDTRSWTIRRVGAGTDAFWPAGDFLLAAASSLSSELELPPAPGLIVYGPDRRERLRLYEGKRPWVMYSDGRRAYVRVDGRVDVLDLVSGRILERRDTAPYPLVPPAATDS